MASITKFSGYMIDTGSEKKVRHLNTKTAELSDTELSAVSNDHCDLADLERPFASAGNNTKMNIHRESMVTPGSVWKHFKGVSVKVIAVGTHSETLETLVIYECDNGVYARPMEMFLSRVDREKYPYAEQEYRFELM